MEVKDELFVSFSRKIEQLQKICILLTLLSLIAGLIRAQYTPHLLKSIYLADEYVQGEFAIDRSFYQRNEYGSLYARSFLASGYINKSIRFTIFLEGFIKRLPKNTRKSLSELMENFPEGKTLQVMYHPELIKGNEDGDNLYSVIPWSENILEQQITLLYYRLKEAFTPFLMLLSILILLRLFAYKS